MENYENLLEKAYKKVKLVETGERFEIPKVQGQIEGTKTIITNLNQIASQLRRSPEHLARFLQKDLASYGAIKADRFILQNKIPSSKINEKIEAYAKEFVICRECGKPDTELIKEGEFTFIKCFACGAKHSVRAKL